MFLSIYKDLSGKASIRIFFIQSYFDVKLTPKQAKLLYNNLKKIHIDSETVRIPYGFLYFFISIHFFLWDFPYCWGFPFRTFPF